MTQEQKNQIAVLRQKGCGYSTIAQALGLSKSTVTSHCQRNNLGGMKSKSVKPIIPDEKYCKQCGKELLQLPGRKETKFCCKACRVKWWNTHQELVNKKAIYYFTCALCQKPFTAYGNSSRKYCSHECYIKDRFKGGNTQ